MPDHVQIQINGKAVAVPPGTTVAVAVLAVGHTAFRRSVTHTPRSPLCGMGICFECRLTVDGILHERTCQLLCRDGMVVVTDAG